MPAALQAYSWFDLWHPGVLLFTVSCQILYLYAVGPVRERKGWGPPPSKGQKAAFLTGVGMIYLAEGTPIHVLAEHYLFSIHMVQHLLLTIVMPVLVLLGTPDWLIRPALQYRWVLAVARVITRPVFALVLYNLIYSIWHFPELYSAALYIHEIHMVQHALLVPTAILMWWPLLSPSPELPRLHPGVQMFYIFLLAVAQIAVFGIITFADHPLYEPYIKAPRVWNISPLVDQQIAGIVMKVLGGFVSTILLTIVFFRWAHQEESASK